MKTKLRVLRLRQKGKLQVWVLWRMKSSILFMALKNVKLSHSKL